MEALEPGSFDIAVMGVPTDEGSPFKGGSRFGCRSLREQSLRFWGGGKGIYNCDEDKEYLMREMMEERIVDAGDSDVIEGCVKWTFENAEYMCSTLLAKVPLVVTLGGDHAITLPLVKAFDAKAQESNTDFHVIHFDAHLDYFPFVHSPDGSESWAYSNGHAFTHVAALKQVKSLTQVGIRSLRNGKEMMDNSIGDGNRVVTMPEFRKLTPGGLAAAIVPEGAKVYVSVDVDVLDLSLVPGCVSGEPNGMMYDELRDTLKAIAERCEVVGFDFVEVNPDLDVGTGATSYLGAHTVIEFLGYICAQPWWKEKVKRTDEHAAISKWY